VRALYWALTLVAAAFLMLFAVSNRATVPLALWPLPVEIDLPAYLLVSATLLAGFVIGAIVAWIGGYHLRRELWRRSRRIAALERQLAATQSRLENNDESTRSALPARSS
jgi:uncharacterized integral membrane protein